MALADKLVQAKNNAVGSNLTANVPDIKQQNPTMFQNNNNSALASTNYQNLSLPNSNIDSYKNQLNNALNNSQYHDINYNKVGMNNKPYANQVNNAINNANPNQYQNTIQNALNQYNGVSNVASLSDLNNIITNTNSTDAQRSQAISDANKYYSKELSQIKNLQQQARTAKSNGQDVSNLSNQYNNIITNGKANDNSIYTPQDSASFMSDMTNRINSLYDTQRNNVGLYYQTGIDQAKQQYEGLRNQASVGNQQNLNKLKESMAQQGLFNSGDNITSQVGINNQYANDLSNYNQQEQNYYNDVNNQIAQRKSEYDAQQAQALMDLGYKADTRSFNMADLLDNRRQNQFSNTMLANNAQYGMSQDQLNNILKGTSMTYGMGRDNVDDQRYNNDTAMKADQINYGRNQDYFNNTLKTIAQQYGMDQDQIDNLLRYAQFNSSEDQRQYQNSTNTNNSNYGMYNDSIRNDQSQQQINLSDRNAQWENSRWAQEFTEKNKQWQSEFDRQGAWHDQAQALAAARAASGGSGRGGGRSSSGSGDYSGTDYKNDFQQQLHDYANASGIQRGYNKDGVLLSELGTKLQGLEGYANNSKNSNADRQYANEQKQALLDGRWYEGRYK